MRFISKFAFQWAYLPKLYKSVNLKKIDHLGLIQNFRIRFYRKKNFSCQRREIQIRFETRLANSVIGFPTRTHKSLLSILEIISPFGKNDKCATIITTLWNKPVLSQTSLNLKQLIVRSRNAQLVVTKFRGVIWRVLVSLIRL